MMDKIHLGDVLVDQYGNKKFVRTILSGGALLEDLKGESEYIRDTDVQYRLKNRKLFPNMHAFNIWAEAFSTGVEILKETADLDNRNPRKTLSSMQAEALLAAIPDYRKVRGYP